MSGASGGGRLAFCFRLLTGVVGDFPPGNNKESINSGNAYGQPICLRTIIHLFAVDILLTGSEMLYGTITTDVATLAGQFDHSIPSTDSRHPRYRLVQVFLQDLKWYDPLLVDDRIQMAMALKCQKSDLAWNTTCISRLELTTIKIHLTYGVVQKKTLKHRSCKCIGAVWSFHILVSHQPTGRVVSCLRGGYKDINVNVMTKMLLNILIHHFKRTFY